MITIEPLGQYDTRYPGGIKEPVLVPIQPAITPPPVIIPEKKKSGLGLLLLIGGVVALVAGYLPEKKPDPIGRLPKKRRGRKLLYMWVAPGKSLEEAKSIPKGSLYWYQHKAAAGRGKVYIIWSESADLARYELRIDPDVRKKGLKEATELWASRIERPERGAYREPEQLPLFSGRKHVRYKRGDLDSVVAAAKRYHARFEYDEPMYVFATAGGYTLQQRPPVGTQSFLTVHPDGRVEEVDPLEEEMKSGREPEQMPLFSGATANCGVWQEVYAPGVGKGRLVWRCMKYAPACEGQPDGETTCVTDPLAEKEKKLRVCVEKKFVDSAFYQKPVKRCARYEAVCTTRACLPEAMPTPEPEPEPEISEGSIKSLAQYYADEWNESLKGDMPDFIKDIKDRGGIKPYRERTRRGKVDEEYMTSVPLFLRRKDGLAPDEMASDMGFRDDSDLYRAIVKVYGSQPLKPTKGMGKKKPVGPVTKTWRDFEEDARQELMQQAREGFGFGQDQPEMFQMKRELVLTPEDIATSDDPLEICLERGGWKLRRVRELQASIAEKAVPDLFTGKKGKLTGGEKMLQDSIDDCFKLIAKGRRTGKAEQMTLFSGSGCRDKEGRFVPVAQCTGRMPPAEEEPLEPPEKPEQRSEEPFMKRNPFTKEQTEAYNRYTHYPIDFNKEFNQQAAAQEGATRAKLAEYEVERTPETVDNALYWYRKQLYEYYLTRFRAQSYAPPPMVVGPAKYPTQRLAKAAAWERKAREKVEKAEKRLHTAINTAVKGKVRRQERTFEEMALETPRRKFGQMFHQMVVDKEKGVKTRYAEDLRRGLFKDTLRKRGRALHKKLIQSAVKEGKPIPENVIKDYKDLIPKANIIAPSEEPPAIKEPWEMTKDEFWREAETNWFKGKRFFNKEVQLTNIRKAVVRDAIEAGKAVPAGVLRDYPEFKKVAPVGFLEGAPAYVWKSTFSEFMARGRTRDDPSLPNELNWILQRMRVNPEGTLRVFKGRLPGHMQRELKDWLWLRYNEPKKWLEDKRLKISRHDGRTYVTYGVNHPFYHVRIRFPRRGDTVHVTEDRSTYHGETVEEAIKEGKPVPVKVLKEYAPYIPEAKLALG